VVELALSVIGNLDKAKALVKEANLSQAKEIISEAEALRVYAEQANKGLEIQNQCAEIKLRAERRVGELLLKMERATPQTANPTGLPMSNVGHGSEYGETLNELKTTRQDAHRWQIESSVPEEVFERYITQTKAKSEELTSKGVLALAIRIKRQREIENAKPFPEGKYQVIYADPPWQYNNSTLGGSAENHYQTLPISQLDVLEDKNSRQVTDLIGDDAVLFLWVSAPFIAEGLDICEAWSFKYKTHFVWVKDRPTYGKLGFYTYSQHELLFVATKGSCLPRTGSFIPSVIVAPKGEHSAKPEITYEIIENMYSGPYIELLPEIGGQVGSTGGLYETREEL
jgi:N6-adenosine-specific RNA methylase IME4